VSIWFEREAAIFWLVSGKVLELGGALLVAYVGFHAARIEILITRHLYRDFVVGEKPEAGISTDLEQVKGDVRKLMELRKEQFGYYEALAVAAGTTLIAIGCFVYLIGLLIEHFG
jgi:hypothetical protein